MEGGGRSSPWLLTKQLCQLAVGAAWGFVIELLEGGGGCVGGREGEGWPCSSNCCSCLSAALGAGGAGCRPQGSPGKFSWRCSSEGDASAIRVRLNVGTVPRRASPARWKAVLCGRAFPSDWWYPAPSSPAESGPCGAHASASIAPASRWGVRSALLSDERGCCSQMLGERAGPWDRAARPSLRRAPAGARRDGAKRGGKARPTCCPLVCRR